MKVFVLGAGASKSYAQSPAGVRMPLAKDFFQTFDQLKISENPWVLQVGLLGYLQEHGVHDPHRHLRSGVDIEALHTEIEGSRDAAIAAGKPFVDYMHESRAYNELIFLFCSVINEIQNGPISDPYRKLASHISADDAVITFNWDTLFDRALAEETEWRPDWGYGVDPRAIFRDGWKQPLAGKPETAPRLVKLHGSTNWITAHAVLDAKGATVLTHDLDPATLHVFESATAPYACFAGRYMAGYEPFSYGYYPPNFLDVPGRPAEEGMTILRVRPKMPWRPEGKSEDAGLVTMPLIIAPVRHKSYGLFGGLFRSLWTKAEDLLALADHIIVIGYSFPQTDTQSGELFQKAFVRRKTFPQVTIVDPAPEEIARRFRDDFGIPQTRLEILKTYFSDAFEFGKL